MNIVIGILTGLVGGSLLATWSPELEAWQIMFVVLGCYAGGRLAGEFD